MSNDLGVLAQIAYAAGIDPIDFAEEQVAILIGIHAVEAGADPGVFLSPELIAFACRVLGVLFEAGWKAPEVPGAEALEVS